MEKEKIIAAVEKASREAKSELDFQMFTMMKARNFGLADTSISDEAKRSIVEMVKNSLDAATTLVMHSLLEILSDESK